MTLEIAKPTRVSEENSGEEATRVETLNQENSYEEEQGDEEELQQEQEDIDLEVGEPEVEDLEQEMAAGFPEVTRGDIFDAFAALGSPGFLSMATGSVLGAGAGEIFAEGTRVTLGTTGTLGLLTKAGAFAGVSGLSLWLGSMMADDSLAETVFNGAAIGNWTALGVNLLNQGGGGSPTTALGATSQFAASMGARVRAAQLSQQGSSRVNRGRSGSKSALNARSKAKGSARSSQRSSRTSSPESGQSKGQSQSEQSESPSRSRRFRGLS